MLSTCRMRLDENNPMERDESKLRVKGEVDYPRVVSQYLSTLGKELTWASLGANDRRALLLSELDVIMVCFNEDLILTERVWARVR